MSRISRCLLSLIVAFAFLSAPVEVFAHKTDKPHTHGKAKGRSRAVMRVERDVNRLEALLVGMNTTAMISDASWKRLANEANMLANRIYANVKATKAGEDALSVARELRMHLRELHKEAHQGNAAAAKEHAREALPFAFTLDDWAS